MNPLLEGIRLRFSEFIAVNVPEGSREHYYSRINAIPNDAIDTKLPFMIKRKLKDLDKIMTRIAQDMRKENIDIKPLEDSIKSLADDLKEADKKFLRM